MINPNKRMMIAPPMAQVVHTMLAQAQAGTPNYSLQRFDGDGAIDRTMSGSARKAEGPPPRPYTVRLTQSGHRQASGG
jgi:hypothetical protein